MNLSCYRWLVAVVVTAVIIPCNSEQARASVADFYRGDHQTSAVDTKGVKHKGKEYAGNTPWMDDLLKVVPTVYPEVERLRRHQGRIVARLTLDPKTGAVTKTTVVSSTGYPALDDHLLAAWRQWRWRPGRWREVTVSGSFRLSQHPPPVPPRGAVRLPTR